VAQPLFFVDPIDPILRDEDRAFMLGEYLLVIVNVDPGSEKSNVEIPKNVKWYTLNLDNETSTELPELKIRAGGIIPIQSPVQYSGELPTYLGLIIALDDNGYASGLVYDDTGDGYDYKTGGYKLIRYTASVENNNILIKRLVEGDYKELDDLPLKITILYKDRIITTTAKQEDYFQVPL